MIDLSSPFVSLPSADSAFADVAHAAHIDLTELNQMPAAAALACQALDVGALDDLATRIGQIAARNVRNLKVLAVVRQVQNAVAFQRRKAGRALQGCGL